MLPALLIVYAALALAYLLSIPPWEAPDEPAHYLRIRDFACRMDLGTAQPWTCAGPRPARELGVWSVQPLDGDEPLDGVCRQIAPPIRRPWDRRHLYSSYMNRRPPLSHLAAAWWFAWNDTVHLPVLVHPANPRIRTPVFLHALDEDPVIAAAIRDFKLLRLPAVFWGLITVGGTWACGLLLLPDKPGVRWLAAALVAFLPQFTFVSAYLNSDALAIALSALLTAWVLYGLSSSRLSFLWWSAGALAFLALAVGARLNSAGLSFTVAGAFAILAFRRDRWRGVLIRSAVLLAAAVAALACLQLFFPALLEIFAEHARGSLRWGDARPWPEAVELIGASFLGVFGWMRIRLPPALYWIAGVWVLLLAVLTVIWWWRPGDGGRSRRTAAKVLALGIAAVALTTLLHAVSIGQPQGRYLFPALPALATLAGAGVCGRLGASRGRRLACALSILLALGNVAVLWGVLRPSYESVGGNRLSRLDTPAGLLIVQHGVRQPDGDGERGYPFDRRGQVLLANPGASRSLRLRAELVAREYHDVLRPAALSSPPVAPADLPGIRSVETDVPQRRRPVRPVWLAGTEGRPGLLARPRSTISFEPVEVLDRTRLAVTFGLLTTSRKHSGDGVEFRVRARGESGSEETLVDRHLDPRTGPGYRSFVTEIVDLSRFAGEMVHWVLETGPGPAGDRSHDQAAWMSVALTGPGREVQMSLCTNRGERITDPRDFEVDIPAGGALTFQLPATLVEGHRGFRLFLEAREQSS